MNAEPIYRQIINHVENLIESGELAYSSKLPAEREMASLFGAARGTVKKAYAELEKAGTISLVWGSGAYVIKKSSGENHPLGEFSDSFFTAILEADLTQKEALEYTNVKLAKAFRCGNVQAAVIDGCSECLEIFSRQLQDFKSLRTSIFLLEDVTKFKNQRLIFSEFDMLLCRSEYYEYLTGFLAESVEKLWEFSAGPSKDTQIDLIKIMNYEKSGLFSQSRAFRDIVNNYVEAKGRRYGEKDHLLAKWVDKDEFDSFISDKRYLIMPPLYGIDIMSEVYEGLFAFLREGGDIIPFNYEIDRSSLLHIEERVQKILYSS